MKSVDMFMRGFAKSSGVPLAGEVWAAWSRQLSDAQIYRIENGGYASGLHEGERYAKGVLKGCTWRAEK